MEQSEQLFAGASRADNATRPILLFYGLSQACRAIAATAVDIPDDAFRLAGHGLRAPNLAGQHLGEVLLHPQSSSRTTFATLQRMLGSPTWDEAVSLAAVWRANPLLAPRPLPDASGKLVPSAVNIMLNHRPDLAGTDGEVMVGLLNVAPTVLQEQSEEGVVALLTKHYPALKASRPPDPRHFEGPPVPLVQHGANGCNLYRAMALPAGMDFETFRAATLIEHHGTWAIPSLGGAGGPTQPLVLWWALLFGLSMRARYEPEGWTGDLDVDHNPFAVTLEQVLELAVQVCPTLVLEAITTVSELA
jgi:hypothetical protein